MVNEVIHISALDCLPFYNEEAKAGVLQSFIESQQGNICYLTTNKKVDDDSKLAEFDYFNKKWNAGRFIGEAFFLHEGQHYKVTIKPRFGENVLLRMLEEIFNIRITKSASIQTKTDDWQHYIKRIIAFIWIQKLANANLHGLPKINITKEHKGQSIKGRISVRQSIKPYYSSGEIISIYREKQFDETISQILFQAYQIIRSDFGIGKGLNLPDAAQDAINQINTSVKHKKIITESDYKNIKYKEIYLSWKPIIDFSWDILKRKQLSIKQKKSKNGFGFFLDMAEIWEQYIRSLLKKKLIPLGWNYNVDRHIAYKGYFFQRELIPDIVFQKGNDLLVWDAKYKRMIGDFRDVDRSDFFQIHTYIQNFLNHKNVKSGGLLYPISIDQPNFKKYKSDYLINEDGNRLNFIIDGIEFNENNENKDYQIKERQFIDRILVNIK
ncbi:5-methylcytosine restriction system specificity protein McrC [Flavobacterium sp. LS1P3]|uniref:5-methylcytosine restriction system specificity protein McrC n=1 Tax=Flavobacterium sp. LS1P3 TaxID=3401720 RepID=UPI003AAF9EF5